MHAMVPAWREGTLLIDGEPAGTLKTQAGFNTFISWSGLDIGRDRASPVSALYAAPFQFTGRLQRVTVTLDAPQQLDGEGVGRAQMARQ
jgi:arylsulfatase